MVKKLLDVVLEQNTVHCSLEDSRKRSSVLGICWQDLIPTIPAEAGYFDWRYAKRRPACTSEANGLVEPRLVHISELVRAEGSIYVEILEIIVMFINY